MKRPIRMCHLYCLVPAAADSPANQDRAEVARSDFRGSAFSEFPDIARESSALGAAMAMTAGIAAATIIRHGIAAHTNSVAKCWRADGASDPSRRELQIAANIVAKTPRATRAHKVKIANLMVHPPKLRLQRCILISSSMGIML